MRSLPAFLPVTLAVTLTPGPGLAMAAVLVAFGVRLATEARRPDSGAIRGSDICCARTT